MSSTPPASPTVPVTGNPLPESAEGKPAAGKAAGGKPSVTADRGFRPDIQGLRAIAVGLVVIYHLFPSALPGGFAGVDVFFVISGYLITGHLWRTCRDGGRVSLVDFWGRRARRLMPASALVLAATWGISYLVLPSSQLAGTAAQIRASALYFQNWQLAGEAVNYLDSSDAASPVQHFWSLSVEEQFYLVWPLLFIAALLVTRFRHRHRHGHGHGHGADGQRATTTKALHATAVALTVTLVVASLAYSVYDTHVNPAAAYFVTTTRMWELGAGGLLALLPAAATARVARQGWLGWAGLALIASSQFILNGRTPFPGWIAVLPVAGALALIAGGSAEGRGGPWRLTSVRPMTFLGGISYSLYLWHFPVIVAWTTWSGHSAGLIAGLLLIAACIALSWLTKVTVEDKVRLTPFIARHKWRSVATALAAVVPVALVSVFLLIQPAPWGGQLGPGYPGSATLAGQVSVPVKKVLPPVDQARDNMPDYWKTDHCLDDPHASTPATCVFGDTSDPTRTVVLVGDSVAGNWWAPLEEIATQEHWELITELHANCPWTAAQLYDPVNQGDYPSCYEWGATLLTDLIMIHPDVVITSSLANDPTLAHPASGSAARADVGAGEATYWAQLQANGIPVIAIRETPDLIHINAQACVSQYGAASPRCQLPRTDADPADTPTSYAARILKGTVPVINMNSLICTPTECPSVVGNVLVYFDSHHLTQAYSQTLAPFLQEKLLAVSATLRTAAREP
jgi:peptidoglycan/LPS O-acetylase OafA/YrhL